jgi:hypothetical protein
VILHILSTMAELRETKVFVCWLVGLFLLSFSREVCNYARMQRVGGQPTRC